MPRDIIIALIEYMGVIAVTMILSLSPAWKQKRAVKFVYRQREGFIALALVGLVTAIPAIIHSQIPSSIFTPPVPTGGGVNPAQDFQYSIDQFVRQAELCVLTALPFLLALAIRRQPWLSAGLGKATWRPSLTLGVALALITIFLTGKTYAILGGLTPGHWLYLAAMAALGFTEELIFRGYLQLRLVDWLGENGGWVASSGVYALWQLPNLIWVEQNPFPLIALRWGMTLVFGLVLGWIMKKTGSIIAPAIYHAIHNWVAIL